jgi:DNA invertase Pin-like site-specific DNA recombinase
MSNTNSHAPKRAILYARVSTEEQAKSGYSLAQQLEPLREYATRESYEVVEEVTDPGQSGASLTRPGMDRVRDLVAAGDVSTVLGQDRDRFARETAYHYLLKKEFEEHGTKLRSHNDRGDDSPEGQFTDDVLDVITATFHLVADEGDRESIERVLEVYADGCPVAWSIKESIEIKSELDFTPA